MAGGAALLPRDDDAAAHTLAAAGVGARPPEPLQHRSQLTPVIRPYDRCHYHVPPGHTRVTAESGHTRDNVTPGILPRYSRSKSGREDLSLYRTVLP